MKEAVNMHTAQTTEKEARSRSIAVNIQEAVVVTEQPQLRLHHKLNSVLVVL
jgi:hypothetical protein